MNKSHAIIYLIQLMGKFNGDWTEEEMRSALLLVNLRSTLEEAPDWVAKTQSLELHETSAIDILNHENREVQMNCMISVLITACADGVLEDSEKNVLDRIISKLNKGITVDELLNAHLAHMQHICKVSNNFFN